jgi:hypothetical protein
MALPRLGQYQLALQHPATAFADPELRSATVETTPMGLPRVISGGFALTYHLTNGRQQWAVRCFHREASEPGRRYQAIGRMIAGSGPGPFVPVDYLDRGIAVEGAWYPVTKMPWLRASPLNRYVETHLDRRPLERLTRGFRALVERLEALGVAHGDLQHGNILVDAFGNLKLVDYDGMYVPALAGMEANESGHLNYQHPRRAGQFDPLLDRFSAAVIVTALQALAADPALWHRHNNGENLLFRRADFDDPDHSPLFAELRSIAAVAPLAERLATLCRVDYASLPPLAQFVAGSPPRRPAVTSTSPGPIVRSQFEVVDGADTERLLHHEGDVVTVVGRIAATRQRWSRQRRPYVVVNIGPDKANGLTLQLWSEALNFFMPTGQVIAAYNGRWVRATGLVAITHRRDAARTPRPQIVINLPSDVQLITDDEAAALRATDGALPWYRINQRRRPAADRPVTAQTAAALNRLYGRPPTADHPPASSKKGSASPGRARPRSATTKPVRRARARKQPQGGAEWWRAFLGWSSGRTGAASASALAALGTGAVSQLVTVTLVLSALATLATLLMLRLLS